MMRLPTRSLGIPTVLVLIGFSAIAGCGASDSSRKARRAPEAGPEGGSTGGRSGGGTGGAAATGGAAGAGGLPITGGATGAGGTAGGSAIDASADARPADASLRSDASLQAPDAGDAAALADAALRDGFAPDTSRYGWVFLRIDDCAGLDDPSLGLTTGSDQPDPSSCNATTVGRAAVCWDQAEYLNELFSGPGCTYKTVPTSACTGGPRQAPLWACVDRLSDAGLDGTPSPDVGGWRFQRIDDCSGNDLTSTDASSLPVASECGPARDGLAAVCWDQVGTTNPASSLPFCTYKSVTAASCVGGARPGFVYVCDSPP